MGQKVNPIGFRLPVNRGWRSRWYASRREFSDFLCSDAKIRKYLQDKLKQAALSKVVIERAWNTVRVTIYTARPGVVIGRKGAEIERMTQDITELTQGKQVKIDIVEIKKPELDAQLVAENVANQLTRRISFRRAVKRAVQMAMEMGAEGIKVRVSGRLGGAEIARTEWVREGTIPLHTLRKEIDYGFCESDTTAGKIGVKCWICVSPEVLAGEVNRPQRERRDRPPRRREGGRGPGGGRPAPGGSGRRSGSDFERRKDSESTAKPEAKVESSTPAAVTESAAASAQESAQAKEEA